MGLGLYPHQAGGKSSKKFEPFGFTPQVANYKTFNGKQVGYSYYDGGRIQTSINSLTSSVYALNKGSNYMGLYYEFIEAWWIAMYLELGTMNAFTERLFGCGYGYYKPSLTNWFSKGYAGTSGGMYKDAKGNVKLTVHWGVWPQYNGITFPMMLEAQKILDDVVKYNMVDAVDSGLLMTYESSGSSNSGSVIMASDYTATYTDESGETISGSVESPTFDGINFELMEEGKKYFTVHTPQDSNGNPMCLGVKDGVMTAVVNVYYKWRRPNRNDTYIVKDSHPIYRGMSMIESYWLQLTGLHRMMRKDIEGSDNSDDGYQHCRWYYCDSWRQVPRDVSVYQHGNGYDYYSVSGDNADEIAKEYTLPLLEGYNRTEESTPIGEGWVKECDYDVSLFMSTKVGASQTSYECGVTWSGPDSWELYSPSNHATISCNASLVGCIATNASAGRSCYADAALRYGYGIYAGGFSHPQIKL